VRSKRSIAKVSVAEKAILASLATLLSCAMMAGARLASVGELVAVNVGGELLVAINVGGELLIMAGRD
jgi:hypothetical protein